MKLKRIKLAALALVAVPLLLSASGCALECVDTYDCAAKAKKAGQPYTCVSGACTAGSPFPASADGGTP